MALEDDDWDDDDDECWEDDEDDDEDEYHWGDEEEEDDDEFLYDRAPLVGTRVSFSRTLYKLTSDRMMTYGALRWQIGEWQETSGRGGLCTGGFLHAYRDPYLGLLLNPMHAAFTNPRLWLAEGFGQYLDDHGLKCGVTRMRLVRELLLPSISNEQRVRVAVLAAHHNSRKEAFKAWAAAWLDGSNREVDPSVFVKCTGWSWENDAIHAAINLLGGNCPLASNCAARSLADSDCLPGAIDGFLDEVFGKDRIEKLLAEPVPEREPVPA